MNDSIQWVSASAPVAAVSFGGKPSVSITHVTIVRGERETEPDVLVVGLDVFATHYVDGAWSFTALLRGTPNVSQNTCIGY